MAWKVRIDDLDISYEDAVELVRRMNEQECDLSEHDRRTWKLWWGPGYYVNYPNPTLSAFLKAQYYNTATL